MFRWRVAESDRDGYGRLSGGASASHAMMPFWRDGEPFGLEWELVVRFVCDLGVLGFLLIEEEGAGVLPRLERWER